MNPKIQSITFDAIDETEIAYAICEATCEYCYGDCLKGPALKQAKAVVEYLKKKVEAGREP